MRLVLSADLRERIVRSGGERADRGVEAVGWLIGCWSGGDALVLDAVESSVSPGSTMTGTRASGPEESELSLSLPRGVGIVGLYHSHPFAKGKEALFHSSVDDATLRTRSSSGKYLSLVTDCEGIEAFLFESGARKGRLDIEALRKGPAPPPAAHGLLELDERVWVDDVTAVADELRGLVEAPAVVKPGAKNAAVGTMTVSPTGSGFELALSVRLAPTAFLPYGDDPIAALRLESADLLDMLVWKNSAAFAQLSRSPGQTEVDLGRVRYSAGGVPYKRFTPPKRRTVARRGR